MFVYNATIMFKEHHSNPDGINANTKDQLQILLHPYQAYLPRDIVSWQKTMIRHPLFRFGLPLAVNVLVCCTILPFFIPHTGGYSFSKLLEVLLWQSIGMAGWPFALMGLALSLPFGAKPANLASFVFILPYPAIQFLLIRSIISKRLGRLDIILVHIFVTISFLIMWYFVLNGYDFMTG